VTGGGDPMPYGKLDDLPDGVPQQRDVVAETHDAWARSDAHVIGSIWLLRERDHVAAYSAVCPHLGCSVGFDANRRVFACPCHASTFATASGDVLGGPAPRGLDSLPLEIKDGTIHVTYERFVLGIKQRRKV
jgi:menaquinol-cytochrome c reductase iron-sulfur subunit